VLWTSPKKKGERDSFLQVTSTSTSMPPQQPFLASSIRGYVCRSCLSKIQKYHRPHAPWLARNVMNDNGPPGPKRLKSQKTVPDNPQTTSEPVIRYWEQTADGQRKEKGFEDDALIAKLESSIKDLEDDIGDTSLLEKVDAERNPWEEDEEEEDIEAALSKDMNLPPAMQAQMEAIEAQLRRIENDPDLENLSEEDRIKIRSELLSGVADTDTEGTFLFYLHSAILTIKKYRLFLLQNVPPESLPRI
jgi:hypothetical protein